MIFINNLAKQINTIIIWCHDWTTRRQIFFRNCSVNIFRIFFYHSCQRTYSTTILRCYDYTAIVLNSPNHLECVASYRTACYKNSYSFTQLFTFLILIQNLLSNLLHYLWRIFKIKPVLTSKYHLLNIFSSHWCRVQFHDITQILKWHPYSVIQMNCLPQLFLCNHHLKEIL